MSARVRGGLSRLRESLARLFGLGQSRPEGRASAPVAGPDQTWDAEDLRSGTTEALVSQDPWDPGAAPPTRATVSNQGDLPQVPETLPPADAPSREATEIEVVAPEQAGGQSDLGDDGDLPPPEITHDSIEPLAASDQDLAAWSDLAALEAEAAGVERDLLPLEPAGSDDDLADAPDAADGVDASADRLFDDDAFVRDLEAEPTEVPDPFDADPQPTVRARKRQADSDDPELEPGSRFDIDAFDPALRQRLWAPDPFDGDDLGVRRAADKADQIASRLDVTKRSEMAAALPWLTELFENLPHPSTFRAILAAADRGLTLDVLRAMVGLKLIWLDRPEWWVARSLSGEIYRLGSGAAAMTWVLARQVCVARADHPPETMIDDEWLDEWLALPRGAPGSLSFAWYVDLRTAEVEAGLLDDGLSIADRAGQLSELGDPWDWNRRVPDPDGVLRRSFRPFSPADDRSGAIRGALPDAPKSKVHQTAAGRPLV